MATLGNPQNTIEVLQKYDFHFQKKFGQKLSDRYPCAGAHRGILQYYKG